MSKKILLIEDDSALAEGLQIILEDEGYNVLPMSDGEALMPSVAQYQPDLILMDFRLPGKDGGELTRSLKETNDTKHIPVVMMSANQQNLREISESVGANAFLLKPFEMDELLNTIEVELSTKKN
jgi:DNA-binding response OmpR family regulator